MVEDKSKLLRRVADIPVTIVIMICLISMYGLIVLYSAAGGNIEPWAYKQFITLCLFMLIALIIAIIDLQIIYSVSYILYFCVLLLLVVVQFIGKSAMGATRWLNLGVITIQPSELMKIALILALARFFHNQERQGIQNGITLIIPLMLSIMPAMLIIKQPDLGTGIIIILVATTMFFLAGVKMIYFVTVILLGTISIPFIWLMVLHDYQKNRILTFLDPEADPLGTGYNIIQSKIAIGSGGLFGKGLLQGTQGQLSFLPEYQTDFIFSFLMEELGFCGGMVLLLLYSLIIINTLLITLACKTTYSKMVVSGIISTFFFHVFINIAMVMGVVPVVGIPLPLISYGRTMMGSIIIGFGLIMNAAVNKQVKIN